jgi:signal transduction histidine kinase
VQIFTYLRLTVLTAGTLLPFFWIVVILGHRRQRNFERVFFFLCLALVFFFGSSLLAANAQFFYATPPPGLLTFAWTFLCLGLWFIPSLALHLHVEYAAIRELLSARTAKIAWLLAAWAPAVILSPSLLRALQLRGNLPFARPTDALGLIFQIWFALAILVAALWQWQFTRNSPDAEQRAFHKAVNSSLLFFLIGYVSLVAMRFAFGKNGGSTPFEAFSIAVMLFGLTPLIDLVRKVQRFNFLQIGRQRNLIYAVFATFLALLYLSFVRRAGLWMESYLPPEATAAILLFIPVVFFEPLQRAVRRVLQKTAQTEVDRAQRMMVPVLEVARLGNLSRLTEFTEQWLKEQFQLADVQLTLNAAMAAGVADSVKGPSPVESFVIHQGARNLGTLRVKAYGAMLSGETEAALEFLCEQLPGALDLCRLIEEKLRLERELAERERLAVLGQMAASISHNLKNPLGSIKTILQVQLESDEMPEGMRAETRMVLEEISRLSAKLKQLLQFSRPAVLGGAVAASCNARAVADEVAGVMRHEAERRGVAFEVTVDGAGAKVAASAEAVSEILSNLVVNALEATTRGGHVSLHGAANCEGFLFCVEDDGGGVPESAREKILQPFFTTKTQGTGLGLAIVARRVAEFGGKLDWKSPVTGGKGTRFEVTIPLSDVGQRLGAPDKSR